MVSCCQQGGLTLMATSRTPNTQPRSRARKVLVKVRGHIVSGSGAHGNYRRLRSILIEAGLIVLVVLTAWAIASISVWWVPVYLVMLVTIFVTPRARQSSPSVSDLGTASDGVGVTHISEGLRVDCVDGAEPYRPVTRSDADFTTAESAESSDLAPDPPVQVQPSALGSSSGSEDGQTSDRAVVGLFSGCLDSSWTR